MKKLHASLSESDNALYPVLAKRWKVDISNMAAVETVAALAESMLNGDAAGRVWDGLDDEQRGALQTLVGSGGHMPLPMFQRFYGEVHKMGAARIEREKPDENPASIADALFYRGLIFEGFQQAESGARAVIYVPPDLLQSLPTHRTAYEGLEEEMAAAGPVLPAGPMEVEEIDAEIIEVVQTASTTIVDDMITLLAFVQLHSPDLDEDEGLLLMDQNDVARLTAHLIDKSYPRVAFLLEMGLSAGLMEFNDGRVFPRRAEARRWLEARRPAQLQALAEAWAVSVVYRELWHIPGLHPEPGGWMYDPTLGRQALRRFLRDLAPHNGWWSIDEFIALIQETDPDFQRPGGDYDSWYIRNDRGDYLDGFESWGAVEGAVLEFYLTGPMHWLGMTDLADDAARLTAYGRGFIEAEPWPNPQIPEEKIAVQADGSLTASRLVPAIERFQLARFTAWDRPADAESGGPYVYLLNAQGIQQASNQGITTEHIKAFVTRLLGDAPVPPPIANLLERWGSGPTASVTLEQLLVLRTTSPETMDFINDTPALRRYLGARLGPMAAIVRADQWEGLRDALGERGIEVDVRG